MTDVLYRNFSPDVDVRSSGDGRTVSGIAVPYNTPQRIDSNLVEQFAPGAFDGLIRAHDAIPRIKFAREHLPLGGTLIGKITLLRDDAKGLYFEARVSDTPTGNETLTLLRDGALDEVSIGFREGQNRRLSDGTIERVTAHLKELAVVMEGAYGRNALVSQVRARGCTCGHGPSRLDEARAVLNGLPTLLPM